jgi:hypothetical protein
MPAHVGIQCNNSITGFPFARERHEQRRSDDAAAPPRCSTESYLLRVNVRQKTGGYHAHTEAFASQNRGEQL